MGIGLKRVSFHILKMFLKTLKAKVYHESIYTLDNLEINISETLVREQIVFKRRYLKYLAYIFAKLLGC